MEHASSFIHCYKPAKSSSDSNLQQPNESLVDSSAPIPINPNKNCEIPITRVNKIMQPCCTEFNIKVKDGAKEMFPPCVLKYISFISGKAYERCQREHRKTLNAEDLLWAMENLGFGDYVGPLRDYLARYRRVQHGNSQHGVSTPINDGQVIYNNGLALLPQHVGNHGPIYGPGPVPTDGFIYQLEPAPMPWALYGPTSQSLHRLTPVHRPLPMPNPDLKMLQSTLPPPPPLSSSQGFSIDSEANLDMVDPVMGMNEFCGDMAGYGSSNNDIGNFDPSIFLNPSPDNM